LHGAPEVRLEYFELVDPDDIQPVSLVTTRPRSAGSMGRRSAANR
jgi:hypothetical protein